MQARGAFGQLDLELLTQRAAHDLAEGFAQIRGATSELRQSVRSIPQRKLARILTHRLEHHVERAAVRVQLVLVSVGQTHVERQTQREVLGFAEQYGEHVRFAARLAGRGVLRREHVGHASSHLCHVEQALEHGHGARFRVC